MTTGSTGRPRGQQSTAAAAVSKLAGSCGNTETDGVWTVNDDGRSRKGYGMGLEVTSLPHIRVVDNYSPVDLRPGVAIGRLKTDLPLDEFTAFACPD